MLRKLLVTLPAFILPLTANAQIIETARIADGLPYIDEDTWFLVDLDNTMFEAKQALGHTLWFYDIMGERMQKGMGRDDAIRESYPDWIKTQSICSVKPLEEDFVPALVSLQNRGIVVMGLTHRQPSVAHSTIRQVDSLGFTFTKTAPSKETFSVPSKTPTLYLEGVLFVGDYNKKADVFLPFLSIIKQNPKKVVFIDDKRKNVEELEHALTAHGIEYVGIHYTALEHAKPIYSREIADFQYQFLDKIMSNEEALILMEKGLE